MVILACGLPESFSSLAAARASGRVVQPATYEELMLACVDGGHGPATYRLYEEAAADGMRWKALSRTARSVLTGRLPPEAEALRGRRGGNNPIRRLGLLGRAARRPRCDPLPQLWVSPARSVTEFDCTSAARGAAGREAALGRAWAAVASHEEPVLFRGACDAWPAVREWDLGLLRRSMRRAMVRVAPSPAVTFCRESHPDVREGRVTPPSRTCVMKVSEFARRLRQRRGGLRPLLYGEDERVYLQALAPHAMMEHTDFSFLSTPPDRPVLGRLWVSAAGTYSPMHYDCQDSYLCQVLVLVRVRVRVSYLLGTATSARCAGTSACCSGRRARSTRCSRTRRITISRAGCRSTRGAANPNPNELTLTLTLTLTLVLTLTLTLTLVLTLTLTLTQVDPRREHEPASWESDALHAAAATPLEARLAPGDVVYFPSRWAHYTEALPAPAAAAGEQAKGAVQGDAEDSGGLSFSLGFRTDGEFLV